MEHFIFHWRTKLPAAWDEVNEQIMWENVYSIKKVLLMIQVVHYAVELSKLMLIDPINFWAGFRNITAGCTFFITRISQRCKIIFLLRMQKISAHICEKMHVLRENFFELSFCSIKQTTLFAIQAKSNFRCWKFGHAITFLTTGVIN